MKKKIYLFSSIIIVAGIIMFLALSLISRAYTISEKEKTQFFEDSILPFTEDISSITTGKDGKIFAEWIDGNLDRSVVPSVVSGIVKGNMLIFNHGAYADIDTKFGIASLSKTFTALLTLRLAEEGILSLDDPVRKYLPELVIEREDIKSQPVTLKHLLAHTSGLPSYGSQNVTFDSKKEIAHIPRQVNPAGYCYIYCNLGYVILKNAIEAAAGKPFAWQLKEKIFDPLEMDSSTGIYSNGTGGIVSTLRDLSKYASMLIYKGRYRDKIIITENSFDKMLAQCVELPPTQVDYYYSLSWEVISVKRNVDSFYKAGRWFGQASVLQVFPHKKLALLFLCNPPDHQTKAFMQWRQKLTGRLQYMLRGISGDRTLCTYWPRLSSEELRRYEGNYINPFSGKKININFYGDNLHSNIYGPSKNLRAFTSNRFLLGDSNILHNFVWRDNRVIGLALTNGYYEIVK